MELGAMECSNIGKNQEIISRNEFKRSKYTKMRVSFYRVAWQCTQVLCNYKKCIQCCTTTANFTMGIFHAEKESCFGNVSFLLTKFQFYEKDEFASKIKTCTSLHTFSDGLKCNVIWHKRIKRLKQDKNSVIFYVSIATFVWHVCNR